MRKLDSIAQERTGPDHVLSLLRRLRLDWLLHHFPPRLVRSLYVFVNGFVTIGLLALLALLNLWLANCCGRADFTGNRAVQVNWLSLSERIRWQ
jgi:uncharacterized membrane protein